MPVAHVLINSLAMGQRGRRQLLMEVWGVQPRRPRCWPRGDIAPEAPGVARLARVARRPCRSRCSALLALARALVLVALALALALAIGRGRVHCEGPWRERRRGRAS